VEFETADQILWLPTSGETAVAKYGPKAQEEVKEAMHEFKEGKLKSGKSKKNNGKKLG
jgi:hypothetical protein